MEPVFDVLIIRLDLHGIEPIKETLDILRQAMATVEDWCQ